MVANKIATKGRMCKLLSDNGRTI